MTETIIEKLSDSDLVAQAHRVYRRSRACNAELVRILIAVHSRRLYLKKAHPSLFEFCLRALGMSNGTAQRFSVAARLASQFPGLVGRIERGEIHLTTLVQMRHYLTEDNADELLELARGRTRYQVEELLASVAPRPDAPSRMRKLATPRTGQSVGPNDRGVEPLAPQRYKVQFTADRETHDDIMQARDLMRHSNPSGHLEPIFKYCVRAGVERLEARQRGLVRQRGRRSTDRRQAPTSRHVPRAVRRAVFARDGAQCTFHDEDGHRCAAKTLLELDHIDPFALGGLHTVENLRVRCRAHNKYSAEKLYGQAFIDERIRGRAEQATNTQPEALKSEPRSWEQSAAKEPKTKEGGAGGAAHPPTGPLTKGLKKTKEPRNREARGSLNGPSIGASG